MRREPVIIYPSKGKLLFLVVAALAMVIIQILFLVYADELAMSETARRRPIGALLVRYVPYIGIPFFGACAIYGIYRLIKVKPSVIVNDEGIYDNSSAVSIGLIRWDEIENLIIHRIGLQKFVGIIPRDYETVKRRLPAWKRALMVGNKSMSAAPFNIPQNILPIPCEDLLAQITSYRQQMLMENGGRTAMQ